VAGTDVVGTMVVVITVIFGEKSPFLAYFHSTNSSEALRTRNK
jgi:hypothetical protein